MPGPLRVDRGKGMGEQIDDRRAHATPRPGRGETGSGGRVAAEKISASCCRKLTGAHSQSFPNPAGFASFNGHLLPPLKVNGCDVGWEWSMAAEMITRLKYARFDSPVREAAPAAELNNHPYQ